MATLLPSVNPSRPSASVDPNLTEEQLAQLAILIARVAVFVLERNQVPRAQIQLNPNFYYYPMPMAIGNPPQAANVAIPPAPLPAVPAPAAAAPAPIPAPAPAAPVDLGPFQQQIILLGNQILGLQAQIGMLANQIQAQQPAAQPQPGPAQPQPGPAQPQPAPAQPQPAPAQPQPAPAAQPDFAQLQAQIEQIRAGIEQIQKAIAAIPLPAPAAPPVDLAPLHQQIQALQDAFENIVPPAPSAPPVDLVPLQEQIAQLGERIQATTEQIIPRLEGIQKGLDEQLQPLRQGIDQIQLQIPAQALAFGNQITKSQEQVQKFIEGAIGDLRAEINLGIQATVQRIPANVDQILPRLGEMQRDFQAKGERLAQIILQNQQQLQQQIAQGGNALAQRMQASEDRLIETMGAERDAVIDNIQALQFQIAAGQQRLEQTLSERMNQSGEQLQKLLQGEFNRLDQEIIPARLQHFHDALLLRILPQLDAQAQSLQRIEPRLDAHSASLQRIEEGEQALRARLQWLSMLVVQRLHALGSMSGLQTGLLLYLLGQVGQLDQRERLDTQQIRQKLETIETLLVILLLQRRAPDEMARANSSPSMHIEVIDEGPSVSDAAPLAVSPQEEPSSELSEQSTSESQIHSRPFPSYSSLARLRGDAMKPFFRFSPLQQNRDDEDDSLPAAINLFHSPYSLSVDLSRHHRPNPEPPFRPFFRPLPPPPPRPPPRSTFSTTRPVVPFRAPSNLTSSNHLIPKRVAKLRLRRSRAGNPKCVIM